MKVIIAGGRDYRFTPADRRWLDGLGITGVITGGARGADECAEKWADERGIQCDVYRAQWDRHGRGAGHIRNRQMADVLAQLDGPKAVILFPGGRGTASMRREAERAGLRVIGECSTQGELGLDERTLLVIEE